MFHLSLPTHRTKHNSFEHNSHIIGLILCHPTTRIWIASSSFVEKNPKKNETVHSTWMASTTITLIIPFITFELTHSSEILWKSSRNIFRPVFGLVRIHSSSLLLDLTTNFKIVNRFHLTVNQFFFFTSPRTFLNLLLLHLETFPSYFFFEMNSGFYKDFVFWIELHLISGYPSFTSDAAVITRRNVNKLYVLFVCVFIANIKLEGEKNAKLKCRYISNLMIIHHWARKWKLGRNKREAELVNGRMIFQLVNQKFKISLQIKFQFPHTRLFVLPCERTRNKRASLFDRYPAFFTFFFTRVPYFSTLIFNGIFSKLNNFISCLLLLLVCRKFCFYGDKLIKLKLTIELKELQKKKKFDYLRLRGKMTKFNDILTIHRSKVCAMNS